jgi:hypothetical protein
VHCSSRACHCAWLSVLADAELLTEPDDYTLSLRIVLTGLLAHRYVKLLRYRERPVGLDLVHDQDDGHRRVMPRGPSDVWLGSVSRARSPPLTHAAS